MTVNEAREKLGLNPVDGGDEVVMPYTKVADNRLTDDNNNEDKEQIEDGE